MRTITVFAMLVVALLGGAPSSTPSPVATGPAGGLPDSEMSHFRSVWLADACVQQRQTWDDYWSWVHRFYLGDGGWTAQSATIVANVRDPGTRADLAQRLEALGIRVSGEWAKANACRKIRTTTGFLNFTERGKPAISTWGAELRDSAAKDSGDGSSIRAAIDDVARQVNAVLGPP